MQRFSQNIDCRFDDGEHISARIIAQQSETPALAETLPPEAYHSASFYQIEMEKVLRHDWLFLGHIAQIPEENDYFTLDVAGEPLLVTRSAGDVKVLSNVCLHRWVPIAQGSGNAKIFVCPFHNWSYNPQGKLVGAPSMQQAEKFVAHDCRLPEIRHEIVAGMIFATFSATVESLSERLAPLMPVLEKYHLSRLSLAYTHDYQCPFNWKMAVETFMECYHHAGIHRGSLEGSFPGRLSRTGESGPGWTICHQPLRKNGEQSEICVEGLIPFEGLDEDDYRRIDLLLIYPNCLISLNPDRVTISAILPRQPQMTDWHRLVLVSDASAAQDSFAQTAATMKSNSLPIIEEDQFINTLQQRGSLSALARPGRLSHLETTVWHFSNFLRTKLAEKTE